MTPATPTQTEHLASTESWPTSLAIGKLLHLDLVQMPLVALFLESCHTWIALCNLGNVFRTSRASANYKQSLNGTKTSIHNLS